MDTLYDTVLLLLLEEGMTRYGSGELHWSAGIADAQEGQDSVQKYIKEERSFAKALFQALSKTGMIITLHPESSWK